MKMRDLFPEGLSRTELMRRIAVYRITKADLIKLFREMESSYRVSLQDFLENYGNFSDQLNKIYTKSEEKSFSGERSTYSRQFCEIQREDFLKILPTTLKKLKFVDTVGDAAILAWLFSEKRAIRAAANNANSLGNASQLDELERRGYKYKEWRTVMDGRERADHAAANGQRVPIDRPFIVGGFRMMFPRDTTFGAPPREIINCRCSMRGR